MNSQLSGNSQEFLRIPNYANQLSFNKIGILEIFGNGKSGLTPGLKFPSLCNSQEFLGIRSYTN